MIFGVQSVGPYQVNCYLVGDEASHEAVLVDPGDEADRLLAWAKDRGVRVTHVLLTHGHLDHIAAVAAVKAATGAKVCIHSSDAPMLTDPQRNLSAHAPEPVTAPPADLMLEDGQVITVGELRFKVLHTPGHTPGGVSFLVSEDGAPQLLLSGDALFAGSIGRTDLPGGDMEALLGGIRSKLLVLPEDLPVYPGHGESTNIGDERENNPFLS